MLFAIQLKHILTKYRFLYSEIATTSLLQCLLKDTVRHNWREKIQYKSLHIYKLTKLIVMIVIIKDSMNEVVITFH